MPFGIDLKSLIIGIILGMYGIPMLMGLINRPAASAAPAV